MRFLMLLTLLLIQSCTTSSVDGTVEPDRVMNEPKDSKTARIVVSIKWTTYNYRSDGEGIKDMMITALNQSKKFIVLENENMHDLESEAKYHKEKNSNFEGADVMLSGNITGMHNDSSGTKGGVRGLTGVLKGVDVGMKSAWVSMDLRLVDVRTRRVIATTKAEGKANSFGVGGYGGYTKSIPFGGNLSHYENTPMEKAIRDVIDKSISFMEKKLPQNYYK